MHAAYNERQALVVAARAEGCGTEQLHLANHWPVAKLHAGLASGRGWTVTRYKIQDTRYKLKFSNYICNCRKNTHIVINVL